MAKVAAKESAEFSKWVSEMGAITDSAAEGGNASPRSQFSSSKDFDISRTMKAGSRREAGEQLDQEMKLLRWHKLANDAALKSAIIKTKRLKAKDVRARGEQKTADKLQWMKHIIREEQSRPLQVGRDYYQRYAKRMQKEDERVEQDIKRHVTSLKRVKNTMRQREELKRRNRLYRERKKEIAERIKLHGEANEASRRARARSRQPSADMLLEPSPDLGSSGREAGSKGSTGNAPRTSKSLGKVLTSLDKLVELEKRIGELENGSRTSRKGSKRTGVVSGGRVAFSKRSVASSGTKRTLYQVRVREKRRSNTSSALTTSSRHRKIASKSLAKRRQVKPKLNQNESTFITSLPDVPAKLSKSQNLSLTSSNSRKRETRRRHSRVIDRGLSKQDRVVKGYLKDKVRRREIAGKSNRPKRISGKDHLKEFREARRQIDRKKRQLSRRVQALPDKEKQYLARHNLDKKQGPRISKKRAATRHKALIIRTKASGRTRVPGTKRRVRQSRNSRVQPTRPPKTQRRRTSQASESPKLGIIGGGIKSHLPTINSRKL